MAMLPRTRRRDRATHDRGEVLRYDAPSLSLSRGGAAISSPVDKQTTHLFSGCGFFWPSFARMRGKQSRRYRSTAESNGF